MKSYSQLIHFSVYYLIYCIIVYLSFKLSSGNDSDLKEDKLIMQRKHTYLRSLLLSALMFAVTGIGGLFGIVPTARAAVVTGLHVSGNQLLDAENHIFRPLGVNRAGAEYMCDASGDTTVFDGPSDATSVNAMASWQINTVRVPLNEDCWLGINGYPAANYSATQYQQAVVDYVNLLNAHNLVAILDLHWSAPGSTQSNKQLAMPDLDHAPAFWNSVATTFKSNSSVIFDLYNEPFAKSWSCWLHGSTAASASPCSDVSFAVAGMQTLVNTVRNAGATNPIMLGGLAYANNLSQWLQNEPDDPSSGLIASFHLYNFNACNSASCWDTQVGQVAAQLPVVTGEMGENDCAHSFIDVAMSWFDQHDIGYLGWAWNTYNCSSFPSLISNYDGTPTAYGQGLKNHLADLRANDGMACKVKYTSYGQWGTGFTTNITITNTGTSTINGWTLTFTFPGNQQVVQGWNGQFSQQGAQVTIRDAGYNGTIAAGDSTDIGFNGSYSISNHKPTVFFLNGQACRNS
jgi:hypothetical protein